MDATTKEDIKRINEALLDLKTIEQLSRAGKAAKAKRDQLKEKSDAEREREKAKADKGKPDKETT